MARALKTKQPRSSVDRFLQKAQISEALAQMDLEGQASALPLSQLETYVSEAHTLAPVQIQAPEQAPRILREAPLHSTPQITIQVSLSSRPNQPQASLSASVSTPAAAVVLQSLPAEPASQPKIKLVSARPESATGQQSLRSRDFLLGRQHEDVLRQMREIISRENGVDLSQSHLMRALLVALADVTPAVKRELSHLGPLKRPPNGVQYEGERAQLEVTLKNVILSAMRG